MSIQGYEWDEAKRTSNLAKHFLDFEDAVFVLENPKGVTVMGHALGEIRLKTVAPLEGRLVTVIWTQRGERRRIISMRRAQDAEERHYHALLDRRF